MDGWPNDQPKQRSFSQALVRPTAGPPPDGITVLQICFAQLNILLTLPASNQIANLSSAFAGAPAAPSERATWELYIVLISVHNTETITLF
jgi:hypothetical protein